MACVGDYFIEKLNATELSQECLGSVLTLLLSAQEKIKSNQVAESNFLTPTESKKNIPRLLEIPNPTKHPVRSFSSRDYAKEKEIQRFLQKIHSEKKEIEHRKQEELKKISELVKLYETEFQSKRKHTEEIKAQMKVQRLNTLKEQASARKELLETYKLYAQNTPRGVPLFKKLQSKYEGSSQKLFTQHNHIQKLYTYTTSEYKKLIERQRQETVERLKEMQEIRLRKNKQTEYSKRVKCTFKPKPDTLKQVESRLARYKLEGPQVYKAPQPFKPPPKLHKSKSVKKVEEPPTPQPPVYDYLRDRRNLRIKLENQLRVGEDFQTNLDPDADAKRKEGLLKYIHSNDPFSLKLIQAEEQVNDVVLDIVRRKISLLN